MTTSQNATAPKPSGIATYMGWGLTTSQNATAPKLSWFLWKLNGCLTTSQNATAPKPSGIATYMGWAFDANLWLNIALSILSLVILVYLVWWKNQPITKAAQEAQNVLSNIKVSDYAKAGYDASIKELQAAAVAQEVEDHD